MIELELPWPPSVNRYWRSVVIGGRSRVLISQEGRRYRDAVTYIVSNSGVAMQSGALSIKRILYCPDWRERDEDNTSKAIYDSLVHAKAISGDQFVCMATAEKRRSVDNVGRVIVQISQLTDGVEVRRSGAWLV